MKGALLAFSFLLVSAYSPQTSVIVYDGQVEMQAADRAVIIGPGEAALATYDGTLAFLAARPVPSAGEKTATWLLPLEGGAWLEEKTAGARHEINTGEIGHAAFDGRVRGHELTRELLDKIVPALKSTLPPHASVGRVLIRLSRGAFGLKAGDSLAIIVPSSGWLSETSPLLHLILLAGEDSSAWRGDSSAGLFGLGGMDAQKRLDENKIRQLFQHITTNVEARRLGGALARIIRGSRFSGRTYQGLADAYAQGELIPVFRSEDASRRRTIAPADYDRIKFHYFLSRIRFDSPGDAVVDVVGTVALEPSSKDSRPLVVGGACRFRVRKTGLDWYLENGHVLTSVWDSVLISFAGMDKVDP